MIAAKAALSPGHDTSHLDLDGPVVQVAVGCFVETLVDFFQLISEVETHI